MKKVVFPLYLLLLVSHLLFANNGDKANKTNMASGRLAALPSKNAGVSDDSGTGLRKQSTAPAPMLVVSCDLNTYQSAIKIAPADFPYTSGSGITVSATSNTQTLTNTNYSCGGNSFSTSQTAWWIDDVGDLITLTFSAPVTSFSVVVNGTNNGEIFTFNAATGTINLSNFCTASFAAIGAGNQLEASNISTSASGTLITINNPTGSTQYTITHNGASAGSRISLLDCFVGDPVPVVDPVSNVQACGTETVPAINFTGTSGATFNWTNSNTTIGLAASGTGNIGSFTAANVTSQQVATITVTPVLGSQTGTPVTFTITVKPKPTLTLGTPSNPTICGGTNGSISFTTTNLPNGIYSLTFTGPGSPKNVLVSGNAFLLLTLGAGTYSNFSLSLNGCSATAAGPVSLEYPSFTWYRDMDGDGFGDPAMTQTACSQPIGYVANNTDCDDNDPLERPNQIWYDDTDNDGYGQTGASPITQCLRPNGYRAAVELQATSGDCNDNNPAIHPGATESCNGIDDNCNGMIDDGLSFVTYYQDNDGDTFGNPAVSQSTCDGPPTGYVSNNLDCNDSNNALNPNTIWYLDADGDNYYTGAGITQCASTGAGYRYTGLTAGGDCNDNNAAINPAATEVCNGIDDNCNSMTDEGLTFVTYYQDNDGDTFGNPAVSQSTCDGPPTGYVSNNLDCNDSNNALNPNTIWYLDADGDNYYTGAGITQCASPGAGYRYTGLTAGGDCNDNNAAVNPAATEVCNGIDDNCNSMTDEGLTFVTYYQDNDGDTFGNPAVSQSTCDGPPTGYVSNNLDCNDSNNALNPNTIWYLDADGDNYYTGAGITQCASPGAGYRYTGLTAGGDCNDNNAAVNPAATEVCNGVDDNCNSMTDEGVSFVTYYQDSDGDTFGNPAVSQSTCDGPPTGYVSNNLDCNDSNNAFNPNTVWYLDADNDNYYTGAGITQCASPGAGYRYTGLTAGGDCNDGNAAINPAATEVCDGIDNDCDSSIDEGVQTTYYRDMDGDGFGNPAVTTMACSLPTGYVANNTDCDDTNDDLNPNTVWYLDADGDNYYTGAGITQCASPGAGYRYTGLTAGGDCNDGNAAINPAATEVCDGIDNDCDSSIDEGVQTTYYRDMDGDGFGNPAVTTMACSLPTGYVANNTDCDDTNDDLNPNTVWYLDADGDDYYTGAGITQCTSPGAGYRYTGLTAGGDCNDGNAAINPAATEVCDGIDNDCDSSVDEGVQTTYYRDMDGDGFGNPAVTTMACSLPTGYVANNTDCDDTNDDLNPNTVWYLDADGDDYYTGAGITQCTSPGAGYRYTGLTAGGDCNDGNAAINPAATEVCDGIDNDCDSSVDEGVQTTYYRDMDGDGFGNPAVTTMACSLPTGYVANNTDCDDTNDDLNPNTVWYLDADGDNYYTGAGITQCTSPGAGYRYTGLTAGGDCNDGNAAINPAATEVCDGIDNDCDSSIDEGVQTTYYRDMDGDGFGNPAVTTMACSLPTGYVANNTDCDDTNDDLNPNTVWYLDADGDNYYTGAGITQCASPGAGYRYTGLTAGGDCNDGNAAINPGATEICDGIDNDCDGLTDIDDPDLMSTPLQMNCPAAQTLPLNSSCSASLPDYRSLANLSGGCGIVTVTQMPLPGTSVSQAGSMIVTIMASDQSGNMQSCTLTVNKLDVTPPSVTCFNGSVSFNGQSSIALDADALSDASDNCGVQSISLSPTSIFATQVGQNVPVTVTVTDLSGNTASCISTVSVSGLPEGWSQVPNGVGCVGGNSNTYNPATGEWTATSTNCFYGPPFTHDASSFAQRRLCGDGSITVQVTSIVGGGWAGVAMRESNAPGAKKAQLLTNLSQYHRREFRTATNGAAQPQQISSNGRHWLRIVRAGNQFTLYASSNGTSWFVVGAQNIVMSNCIEMGLIATNHTANSSVTATFANMSFTGSNSTLGSPLSPQALASLDSPLTPEFDVYPNPTGGELNVDLTQYVGRDVRIEVYSIEGKLLQFREIEEVQTTVENLNLSQYAGGMYFVKIKSHDLPDATRRVVLQRE